MYYKQEKTIGEIAAALNKTKRQVQYALQKGMGKVGDQRQHRPHTTLGSYKLTAADADYIILLVQTFPW